MRVRAASVFDFFRTASDTCCQLAIPVFKLSLVNATGSAQRRSRGSDGMNTVDLPIRTLGEKLTTRVQAGQAGRLVAGEKLRETWEGRSKCRALAEGRH